MGTEKKLVVSLSVQKAMALCLMTKKGLKVWRGLERTRAGKDLRASRVLYPAHGGAKMARMYQVLKHSSDAG